MEPITESREPTRDEIEASIQRAKDAIQALGDGAHLTAMDIEENGLMFQGARLTYAGRTEGYEPVRHHPVWGPEIQSVYAQERREGITTGPLAPEERDERWFTMERWEREVSEPGRER